VKRETITLDDIASLKNLGLAAWKAARGKRGRADVVRFLAGSDRSLECLGRDTLAGLAPYGTYRSFLIHDPKTRLIHAASFEDRVLHHAILNLAEPVFERSLVPTTYACRPGRGVHRAVRQVQSNLRRFPWFGKVDIEGYFPSIDHRRLKELLARRFKGTPFLELLGRVIDSYEARPGTGLPIGSLTSQHFANLYLDGADRFLLAHPMVRAHVRYMDDILWWGEDKASVVNVLGELRTYLMDHRALAVKASAQVNRSAHGVTYCGHRVTTGAIRLSPRRKTRYRILRARLERDWCDGRIDGEELQRGYEAVHAITLHSDSAGWRRRHLALHPSKVQLDD